MFDFLLYVIIRRKSRGFNKVIVLEVLAKLISLSLQSNVNLSSLSLVMLAQSWGQISNQSDLL